MEIAPIRAELRISRWVALALSAVMDQPHFGCSLLEEPRLSSAKSFFGGRQVSHCPVDRLILLTDLRKPSEELDI